MKLLELIETDNLATLEIITSESLEFMKEFLLKCDEFKNVKKLNILKSPMYALYKNGAVTAAQVESLVVDENTVLNETVDLYSISISKSYKVERLKLKPGFWKLPTQYNPDTFSPVSEIRFVYLPELNQDSSIINHEDFVADIVNEFITCLNGPVNAEIPYDLKIQIRCSSRSFKLA